MTTADIEQKFRNWADPHAAGNTTEGIEGGHGNGGKCYMTQMFASYSLIHTTCEGRGNKYGFKVGNIKPGYFPSVEEGRGYPVHAPAKELAEALKLFELNVADLPDCARTMWEHRNSFTLVLGVGARSLAENRIPYNRWVENLQGHQQTV